MTRHGLAQIRRGLRKGWFYARHFAIYYMPSRLRRWYGRRAIHSLTEQEREAVAFRASYYARCKHYSHPEQLPHCIANYKYPYGKQQKFGTYVLDLYRGLSCFPPHLRFDYLFGDITETFPRPTIVKSRPVADSFNSVLLKLNSERHFQWVSDKLPFEAKKDMIVSRNVVNQPQRALLLEKYCNHPMCNFGMINNDNFMEHPEWHKSFMTKEEQLLYKFIMCVEGHDVATNLKWVMSSHSIAVMPRPKFETWFMEGTLKPFVHYIEVADDYSDLIEKVSYYMSHPEEAQRIIMHANSYVAQFRNRKVEFAAELMTLSRYFALTNQEHDFI